jgi:hypothetical protein
MIYNEQWKIDKRIGGKISDIYPGPYSKCGHLKGAIAWNASGKGFWITHSFVNFGFPPLNLSSLIALAKVSELSSLGVPRIH